MEQACIKIVMLGDASVGKTSLVLRYVVDEFNDETECTINASYLEKEVFTEGISSIIGIWDTAGQEKFTVIAPIYYRNSEGAILVYDIARVSSFERIDKWLKELKMNGEKNIAMALVGNKCDQNQQRKVARHIAEEYAKTNNMMYFETSAKTNMGIQELFEHMTIGID